MKRGISLLISLFLFMNIGFVFAVEACTDSDGGEDIFEKGTLNFSNIYGVPQIHNDRCNGLFEVWELNCEYVIVSEGLCENGCNIFLKNLECPSGFVCDQGACTETGQTCEDSDGGKNYNEEGEVVTVSLSEFGKNTRKYGDSCIDEKNANETYCENNNLVWEQRECEYDCFNSVCTERTFVETINETGNGEDVDNESQNQEEVIETICEGCKTDRGCYTLGYRKDGNYCTDNGEFVEQFGGGAICENNFECSSNVCVSGQCVEASLIQKILNWLRNLFGRGN